MTTQFASLIRKYAFSSQAAAGSAIILCAGAGAAFLCNTSEKRTLLPVRTAECQGLRNQEAAGLKTPGLLEWAEQRGANVAALDVHTSQIVGGSGGRGVFASAAAPKYIQGQRSWWQFLWRWGTSKAPLVAEFPLSMAITAENVLQDPELGVAYRALMDAGVVDEPGIIQLFLVVEKHRGAASQVAPYIQMLPTTFDTPMCWSEAELAELKGTALAGATRALRRMLVARWRPLEPLVQEMLKQVGVADSSPNLEDWCWAYCVFWSRGLSLPVPPDQGSKQLAGEPAAAKVLDALVPVLDFCNHDSHPQCWWQVVRQAPAGKAAGKEVEVKQEGGSGPLAVQLRMRSGARPLRVGEELKISYGDRSNEELLMCYGFTQVSNRHDHLMVPLPLPPVAEWDEVMHIRAALLKRRGLKPQLFLPSDALPADKQAPAPAATSPAPPSSSKSSRASQPGTSDSASGGSAGGGSVVAATGWRTQLPAQLWPVLEVLVLREQELVDCLAALERPDLAPAPPSPSSPDLGLQLGMTSTLVRLLEQRVVELEGESGTGTWEADCALLEAWAQTHPASQHTPSSEVRRYNALVYRTEQKRLAREYLVLARKEMQALLHTMSQQRS